MSEWKKYEGTDEQIAEMINAEKITQNRLMERLNYNQDNLGEDKDETRD